MLRTMPLPVETQVPDDLIPAYCELCGEVVIGLRATDEQPIGYRYRVLRLFEGICEQCRRDQRRSRRRDGPVELH